MIKFSLIVCDNCRAVLFSGKITPDAEQQDNIITLESSFTNGQTAREGVHVCNKRCNRGEYYNKSKHARQIMHKHYYELKKGDPTGSPNHDD
jgi:hypothetical protein